MSATEDPMARPFAYRVWVNDDRTVLFRLWETGEAEVAFREERSHSWGPPVRMEEER